MPKVPGEVFDPENAEFGFDEAAVRSASERSRRLGVFVRAVTSTPLKGGLRRAEVSFDVEGILKLSGMALSRLVDSDSGYVSNHQESNSMEKFNENSELGNRTSGGLRFVYMNEDALLEKPQSESDSSDTTRIDDSFGEDSNPNIHRFAISNLIEDESGISSEQAKESPDIPIVSPIILTEEKLEIITKTVPSEINNDGSINSNVENDSNYLNMQQNESENSLKENFIIPLFSEEKLDIITQTVSSEINNDESISSNIENNSNYLNIQNIQEDESEVSLKQPNENPMTIPIISPIVITEENLDITTKTVSSELNNESTDSNTENNSNYLNIQPSISRLKPHPKYENIQMINITQTPEKASSNPVDPSLSPDLFSDEDLDSSFIRNSQCRVPKMEYKEKYVLKQDRKLFRRAKEMLVGVAPSQTLLHVNLTVSQMLERYEQNRNLILTREHVAERNKMKLEEPKMKNCDSTFLITEKGKGSLGNDFPEILEERYFGLHYNRSKLSEETEQLGMKYASKFIGNETQSSCTVFRPNFPSSPSKISQRLRWAVKSPGKRLSHLARRRITFSSAALQSQSRQVAFDPNRLKLLSRARKSPRRTPKKSPAKKIKTPSSSAKKRLSSQLRLMAEKMPGVASGSSKVAATKRALFQSPDKSLQNAKGCSPFKKRTNLKCALFASPRKNSGGGKRKRNDSETESHPNKFPRSLSLSEVRDDSNKVTLENRVKSEMFLKSLPGKFELNETHKKKLLWAIYEALRGQRIPVDHPQYKQYASTLFRVTRRFLPDLSANAPRPEGGTSERMLKIARQHIGAVLAGKSVDDIVQEYQLKRTKNLIKPGGDLAPPKNDESTRDGVPNVQCEAKKPEIRRIDKVRKVINFDGR